LQPAHGPLQKRQWRQDRAANTKKDRLQHKADEPKVVEHRQPAHAVAGFVELAGVLQEP
jgi:hypothetical protein